MKYNLHKVAGKGISHSEKNVACVPVIHRSAHQVATGSCLAEGNQHTSVLYCTLTDQQSTIAIHMQPVPAPLMELVLIVVYNILPGDEIGCELAAEQQNLRCTWA